MVVSGFLGAGKTTLVRRLLDDAQRTGVRVAVISNEFGALGIDQALLGETGDAYVEIEGGCVCCRLSDELVARCSGSVSDPSGSSSRRLGWRFPSTPS
jgi:G3E family GTPase